MKKFLVAVLVSALFFAVSCGSGSKEESKKVVEEKSTVISAEEGGEIEIAGGEAKIKIPAGALEKDTEISAKLYKTDGFKNKNSLASNVVEFGPNGLKFKKPVIITIKAGKAVKDKTVAAAVMKSDGSWSYSEKGAYAVFGGFNEAGDPIMETAAGDPIMISNGNLTTAAGDPIMNAAAGDPIMLSAAGDPIMTNAAGDPIMNAAAGDPIMMTTGHFSDYTFIVVDEAKEEKEKEKEEEDDDDKDTTNPGNQQNPGDKPSGDVTCKTIKEWDTIYGDKEDADYDDKENESIYCQKTGEMLVYCLYGDFNGSYSNIYSIKVGDKEFKCESENHEDCFFKMEQYCEALDGEYEDGFYCEEEGVCEKTGETSKVCASTKGDGNFYYQVGDRKFECNEENMQSCYEEYYEYCGDTTSEEDEYEEEIPEECSYYMYCENGDFDIYRCTPEDDDIYIFYSGYSQECDEPEEDMEKCDKELALFSDSCSNHE